MVYFNFFVNKSSMFYVALLLELNFCKVNVKCARCFYKLFKQRKVREKGKTKKN